MRENWRNYFMKIAQVVSTRSTCDRLHVGAVLIKNRRIISTGYNGSLPGVPHCDDKGHDLVDGHCIRTVHAEINAISYAARYGVPTEGATMIITHFPCINCFKGIVSAGIGKVLYGEIYGDQSQTERYIEMVGGHHYPNEKMIQLSGKDINGI